VAFREHVQDRSSVDYRLGEHQIIADFIALLRMQLADLRERIVAEIDERRERKRWRNTAKEPGKPTWWETEDLPRIEELGRFKQEIDRLHAVLQRWSGLYFLPPGTCLRQQPQSTPLFRNNQVYRSAFRVMAGHFLAYRASLDTRAILTRARSLPVLYEWWCAVRVLRILLEGLAPQPNDALNRPIVTTRLVAEGKRFTIEFSSDQAITFTDGRGGRVRFRYQPEYRARGSSVAVLGGSGLRTPDIAIEVFPAQHVSDQVPKLIIVLDAKYSSQPQEVKRDEIKTKYSSIGDSQTGLILSRQVWALTPKAPSVPAAGGELGRYCNVDNGAFWSDGFDVNNPVHGAVQTRPVLPTAFDPLRALLSRLLRLAGIAYTDANATDSPSTAS
jgi:hypothetical protein